MGNKVIEFTTWQLMPHSKVVISIEEEAAAQLARTNPESIFFFAELS